MFVKCLGGNRSRVKCKTFFVKGEESYVTVKYHGGG